MASKDEAENTRRSDTKIASDLTKVDSDAISLTKPSRGTVTADLIGSRNGDYAWAKQADLVRATNQVLESGKLSKGVLSRACSHRLIETNGESGQRSRVNVPSFLCWVKRKFNLANDEQIQIRNAIIGEISERNS